MVKVRAVAAAAAAGAGTSITVEKDKKLRPADGSVDGVSTFVVVSFVFSVFLLNRRLGILVWFLQCQALKRVVSFLANNDSDKMDKRGSKGKIFDTGTLG